MPSISSKCRYVRTSPRKIPSVSSTTANPSYFGRSLTEGSTIEPPCATISRKHERPPIQNTNFFPVKSQQLEPLVNEFFSQATAAIFR